MGSAKQPQERLLPPQPALSQIRPGTGCPEAAPRDVQELREPLSITERIYPAETDRRKISSGSGIPG